LSTRFSLLTAGVSEQLPLPSLIIIDGLDECTDGTRHEIVNTILRVGRRFTIPLVFLFASRPEQDISLVMSPAKVGADVVRIALDTEYGSYGDIEHYIRDEISEIRNTHPLRSTLPPSWPPNDDIRTLVLKSSGQFIYAATSVKYIGSRRHHPTRRLDVIRGIVSPGPSDLPFAELDSLYKFIIYSTDDVRLTVRLLIIMTEMYVSLPSPIFDSLLSLEPGDSVLRLSDLASLVSIKEVEGSSYFHNLHASLYDFLVDPARSGALYLDPGLLWADIVRRCLNLLGDDNHPGGCHSVLSMSQLGIIQNS